MTVDEAVNEAVQKNLALLTEREELSIADAALISARLRPNPVLSGSADSLDLLGTGFNETNGAGPPQYASASTCRSSEATSVLSGRTLPITPDEWSKQESRTFFDGFLGC